MPDRALTEMTDAELDLWLSRKRDLLARATSLRDGAEAEVEKFSGLVAESELHESPDLDALREAFHNAVAARGGRRGAYASARLALDAALAEQARRAVLGAEANAIASRDAFKLHVESTATKMLERAKATTADRATLRELAQVCRFADNALRKVSGEKALQHVLVAHVDPYGDRMALEAAAPGLHEVVSTLCDYDAGDLLAQINARNAEEARQRFAVRGAG